MWDTLFSLTNMAALVGWVMLALLPRKPFVTSFIMYGIVAILCLTYTLMFAALLSGGFDPQAAPGAGEAGFTTLDGIMALFDSRAGATIGWTHYLAFDLFVGLWIAGDADNKGFGRVWQVPILFVTLMAGPVGLFIWLALREPAARRAARARAAT
jgi:hypothetical protein